MIMSDINFENPLMKALLEKRLSKIELGAASDVSKAIKGQEVKEIKVKILKMYGYYVYYGCPYSSAQLRNINEDNSTAITCNCRRCNGMRKVVPTKMRRLSFLAGDGKNFVILRMPVFSDKIAYVEGETKENIEKLWVGKTIIFNGYYNDQKEITLTELEDKPKILAHDVYVTAFEEVGSETLKPKAPSNSNELIQSNLIKIKTWLKYAFNAKPVRAETLERFITNQLNQDISLYLEFFDIIEENGVKYYKYKGSLD